MAIIRSSNGTFVNGAPPYPLLFVYCLLRRPTHPTGKRLEKNKKRVLAHGDEISLGLNPTAHAGTAAKNESVTLLYLSVKAPKAGEVRDRSHDGRRERCRRAHVIRFATRLIFFLCFLPVRGVFQLSVSDPSVRLTTFLPRS